MEGLEIMRARAPELWLSALRPAQARLSEQPVQAAIVRDFEMASK